MIRRTLVWPQTFAGACRLAVAILAFVATGVFALRVAKQQPRSAFLDEHSCAQAIIELETRGSQDGQAAAYWSELADTCLEDGLIVKAFECYENAIAADPANSTAYHDLGNVLLLFRKEAARHYDLDAQRLFDLVFDLYDQALSLDADSFPLATDIALSYYLVQPSRPAQALRAWQNALELAPTDEDRAEVRLHLARTQINAGLFDAANNSLAQIKDSAYAEAKERLARRLRGGLLRPTVLESGSSVEEDRSKAYIEAQSPPLATAEPQSRMLDSTPFNEFLNSPFNSAR